MKSNLSSSYYTSVVTFLKMIVSTVVLLCLYLPFYYFSLAVAFLRNPILSEHLKVSHRYLSSLEISGGSESVSKSKKSICVVGGGFGGLYTALKIGRCISSKEYEEGTRVYLIDPKDRFVFLPLLYELTVGTASPVEVAPKYSDLLAGSKVTFVQGTLDTIDFQNNLCLVKPANSHSVENINESIQQIHYDQLVLAVGNQPRLDLVKGAKEFSIPFYRLEDSNKLKTVLASLKKKIGSRFARIVIMGAGYSGIELATNIAEFFGKENVNIKVVDKNTKIMINSANYNREVAEKSLAHYGITVQYNTTVKEVKAHGVLMEDETGSEYFQDADISIFTAGSEQSAVVRNLQLTKDPRGRIVTTKTLQTKDYSNVFALGDCGVIEGDILPATAQVALQQADTVSKNVIAQRREMLRVNSHDVSAINDKLEEFEFLPLGEMLTLGPLDGAISSLGGIVALSGPLAALGRRAVYAVRMPTLTQKVKALITAGSVTTGNIISTLFPRESL